jgi:hypothetical protein
MYGENVMNLSEGSRYENIETSGFFRVPVNYTKKEKSKIINYFSENNQELAFKEISHHISTLISCLNPSGLSPTNIKRKESVAEVKELQLQLQSLENLIQEWLNRPFHQNTIKLKKAFSKYCYKTSFEGSSLRALTDLILYAKLACMEISKTPSKSGKKDPHYHEAIANLASVWSKYIGKPTRRYDPDLAKTYGPFLDYINWAIKPPIKRFNKDIKKINTVLRKRKDFNIKMLRKEIPPCPSFPNIARAYIKRMAKISSK